MYILYLIFKKYFRAEILSYLNNSLLKLHSADSTDDLIWRQSQTMQKKRLVGLIMGPIVICLGFEDILLLCQISRDRCMWL